MHNRKYLHTTASACAHEYGRLRTQPQAPAHTSTGAFAHNRKRLRARVRAPSHTTASTYAHNRELLHTQPRAPSHTTASNRKFSRAQPQAPVRITLYTYIYTCMRICTHIKFIYTHPHVLPHIRALNSARAAKHTPLLYNADACFVINFLKQT